MPKKKNWFQQYKEEIIWTIGIILIILLFLRGFGVI